MPPERDLGQLLKTYAALSKADRKAVLRQLSASERQALRQAARTPPRTALERALATYSPRLAKQLAAIAQGSPGRAPTGISDATRRAVLDALNLSGSLP